MADFKIMPERDEEESQQATLVPAPVQRNEPVLPVLENPSAAMDFDARSAEVLAVQRINNAAAEQQNETQQRFAKTTEESILLSLEGATNLNRAQKTRGGLIGLLDTTFNDGIGAAARDVTGLTQFKARDQLARGQALSQAAEANANAELNEIETQRARALSPFVAAQQQAEIGREILEFGQAERRLRISERNSDLTAQRLNFDLLQAQRTARRNAKDDFLENLTVQGVDSILMHLDQNGAEAFTTRDPNSDIDFTLSRDALTQHRQKRRLLDAQLVASLATADLENREATNAIDEDVLSKMPMNALRAIQANQGAYDWTDPNSGETFSKQFRPEIVNSVVETRENARQSRSLGLGVLSPEDDPILATVENRIKTAHHAFERVQANTEALIPGGSFDNVLLSKSAEITADLAQGLNFTASLMAEDENERIALTQPLLEQFEKDTAQLEKNIEDFAGQVAKRFAGGDKEVEAYTKNRITGTLSSPELTAEAFGVMATNRKSVLNSMSTRATQGAMDAFANDLADRIRSASNANGALGDPLEGRRGSDALLAFLANSEARRTSKLSDEDLQQLQSEAIAFAGQVYQNDLRDTILGGDLSMLPQMQQDQLIEHPFMNLPLDKIVARAESRMRKFAANHRMDPTDPALENTFLQSYAEVLQEIAIDDPRFENAFEVYEDFVQQPALRQALIGISQGHGQGTIADQAALELFGGDAARFVDNRLDTIRQTGIQIGIEADEAISSERAAFRNSGFQRMTEILMRMPPEVINDEQIGQFQDAVSDHFRREFMLSGNRIAINDIPNRTIEGFILGGELTDNPPMEKVRKRVAKEWKTVAPIADRGFFAQNAR